MKNKNLNKLSFDKKVISNLNLQKVMGGGNLPSVKGSPIECESSLNHECNFACHN